MLASYSAATIAGGDGFLGAFAAGLAVTLLNQSLCSCFLEYGEVTSEMAMLLAFVLFGAVLSTMLDIPPLVPALILAGLVIFILRPSVLGLVLLKAKLSWPARGFISWFGPRGLNSLLLALLVVQAELPGAELMLATVGLVVLASTTIHGATATPAGRWYGRRAERETLVEEREATASGLFIDEAIEESLVTPEELHELVGETNPPLILDVRSRSTYLNDGSGVPGSLRVLPDQASEWAASHSPDNSEKLVVTYCT